MDQRQWDEAYASAELVWTAEANRFVVEELAGLAAGARSTSAPVRAATPSGWPNAAGR